MGLRDRVRSMGLGLPDMGRLTDMFDQRFEELIGEIRQMRQLLTEIRDQGRPQ